MHLVGPSYMLLTNYHWQLLSLYLLSAASNKGTSYMFFSLAEKAKSPVSHHPSGSAVWVPRPPISWHFTVPLLLPLGFSSWLGVGETSLGKRRVMMARSTFPMTRYHNTLSRILRSSPADLGPVLWLHTDLPPSSPRIYSPPIFTCKN